MIEAARMSFVYKEALRELVEKAGALCEEEAECVGHPLRVDGKENCPLAETRSTILKAKALLGEKDDLS